MKSMFSATAILLAASMMAACQSQTTSAQAGEAPTCRDTTADCLVSWDRHVEKTRIDYEQCQAKSERCERAEDRYQAARAAFLLLHPR